MYNPGGIRFPEGTDVAIKPVRRGIYSFSNAYEGQYEYFEGRPIGDVEPDQALLESCEDVPNQNSSATESGKA